MEIQKPKILSEEEIQEELKTLHGWVLENPPKADVNKIKKQFEFESFRELIAFINWIGPFFDKNDHHPDMTINYKKVLFELCRYDVGCKLTDKDFMTAHEIERRF